MAYLNFDILKGNTTSDNKPEQDLTPTVIPVSEGEEPAKRKRGRPRKSEQQPQQATAEIIPSAGTNPVNTVSMCQTSEPYIDTFNETNDMLKYSIMQLDVLTSDVKNELDSIRSSKTLKGKYKYISDLCATASSLVSSKISAIKEINAVTHNCHKLELQRVKDIKNSAANQQDDDKYITDLYNAYINTPVGAGPNPALQYTSSNVAGNMQALMGGVNTIPVNEDQNFQNYMSNLTPEQNRMILGDKSNIETVVVYDPTTGEKSFEVIDSSTGISVPNYPRPNAGLLDDTSIDMATGIASNTNIGQSWKVVVLGDMINKF
jgi:hypothetical protein